MPYIPHTTEDREAMLAAIGAGTLADLFADIPVGVGIDDGSLPPARSESEVVSFMQDLAERNASSRSHVCLLGGGVYDHWIPAIVPWLLNRSEFMTAYAPYQAEMSQGTLQGMFEFQTMVCRLMGLEVANASFYDGSTAVAAAVIMAMKKEPDRNVVVLGHFLRHHRRVIETHLTGLGLEVEFPATPPSGTLEPALIAGHPRADRLLAVVVSCPNGFGAIPDMPALAEATHRHGAAFIASVDPVSLGVLRNPGSYDADIAVAEGQGLGIPLSFGGPLLGMMAAKESYLRVMPGRISGMAHDAQGRRGFVMTLQTREQHIRRERATSNICSNQALNALAACIHLAAVGRRGLTDVAEHCLRKARHLRERIRALPEFRLLFPAADSFKEFAVRCPVPARTLIDRALNDRILLGIPLEETTGDARDLLIAVTERRTRAELDRVVSFLEKQRA